MEKQSRIKAVIGNLQEHGMVAKGNISPSLTAAMGMGGGQIPMIVTQENKQECRVIGCMNNKADHTFESANRVYDIFALAPTIPTCGGGGIQPKVITKL